MNKQILYLLVLLLVTLSYTRPCSKIMFNLLGQHYNEGKIVTKEWCENYCKLYNLTQIGNPCSCSTSYKYGTVGREC